MKDQRSALFYDASRVLKDIRDVATEEGLRVFRFLENVVADDSDIAEMSSELEMRPILVDSEDHSRAKRPRLYWLSTPLMEVEGVAKMTKGQYDVLSYEGEMEDMNDVLVKDWTWRHGEADPKLRFPTFTRSIKRKRPPKRPAGISHTNEKALERWKLHEYRFPPYTYDRKYLVEGPNGRMRILHSSEREVLMGYERGHTQEMVKKEPESHEEQVEMEDLRCSALGNSFHTLTVACILDHALWSLGVKPLWGHQRIIEDERERQKDARDRPDLGWERPSDESMPPHEADPGSETEQEVFAMEQLSEKVKPSETAFMEAVERDPKMAVAMVSAFIRRQEYRGSDVRLDVGTLYRADSFPRATVNLHRWLWHIAHAYRFEREEHINVLELRAILHCLEWRARRSGFGDCRCLHLSDSQVALSVCVKGRSSSRQLNRVLRKLPPWKWPVGSFQCWLGLRVTSIRPMNHQGDMSPKAKVIMPGSSRQHRKVERQKFGSLSSQIVEVKTRARYEECFEKFRKFHRLQAEFGLPEATLFDEMVGEYVEYLWESGEAKSEASYTLAAIQYFRPQAKSHLPWSWKLAKAWNRIELPTRATPLSPEMVLSFAGQCFRWKQNNMGWLLILGFSMFLRTGEILNLRRKDVILPKGQASPILLLENTKTTKKNFLPLEKLVVDEKICVVALQHLCKSIDPGERLCSYTNYGFRKLWADLLSYFSLEELGYMPYSLRRGGATSAYKAGVSLDVLVTKGRWQHVTTARLYLDQGLQSLAQIALPQATQRKLHQAQQYFVSVSQEGTRGRGKGEKKRKRSIG